MFKEPNDMFKRNDERGGYAGKKFGGRDSGSRGYGDRDSFRPEMHKAECAKCGKMAEVPFKPNGRKPVYCSDCFKREEGGAPSRFDSRDSARPQFGEKRLFEATCDKCGERCEVPFRPTGEKPVYCRVCFGKEGRGESQSFSRPQSQSFSQPKDQYKYQFDAINAKLDKIMKALGLETAPEKKPVPVAPVAKPSDLVIDDKRAEAAKKPAAKVVEETKKPADKDTGEKTKAKKPAAKKKAGK